ncbi:MAG: hypothetical protein AVDCRST_MAG03-2349, partial [uncultured Rubrobacteraceae bacterium]
EHSEEDGHRRRGLGADDVGRGVPGPGHRRRAHPGRGVRQQHQRGGHAPRRVQPRLRQHGRPHRRARVGHEPGGVGGRAGRRKLGSQLPERRV